MQNKVSRILRQLAATSLLLILAACTSTAPTPTVTPPAEQIVPPVLTGTDPVEAAPGETIIVIGSGGYATVAGGYNESSRSFPLTWDGEPAGDLVCYVNHCESQFTIPADTVPGDHIIAVEGGSTLTITVTAP